MKQILFLILLITIPSIAYSQMSQGNFLDLESYIEEKTTQYPLVVVNFWATWCAPCMKEMPYLIEAQKNNPNVEFIFVSLDFENQLETKLLPFIRKKNIVNKVFFLKEELNTESINLISTEWSGSIPATLYISSDKKVFHEGVYGTHEEINNQIQSILK